MTHSFAPAQGTVTATDEPDAAGQAATANRFAATVYVGFEARAENVATVSYYAIPTFESAGGRSLAHRLVQTFEQRVPLVPLAAQGMRLAVLRETRMPAVLCAIGPVQQVVDQTPSVAEPSRGPRDLGRRAVLIRKARASTGCGRRSAFGAASRP